MSDHMSSRAESRDLGDGWCQSHDQASRPPPRSLDFARDDKRTRFILHPSSFIPHPSFFILHSSSFILHPSSLIPHPSSLIPHPSSLILHPSSLIPHPSLFHGSSQRSSS